LEGRKGKQDASTCFETLVIAFESRFVSTISMNRFDGNYESKEAVLLISKVKKVLTLPGIANSV
jgi:hypothetical protein